MNELDIDKMYKFEDLQKAGCILRKALKEIKTITSANNSNANSLNLSSSSSSNNSSIYNKQDLDSDQEHELVNNSPSYASSQPLAFDNLTYMSSVEDLTQIKQITTNQEVFKKTLKSIKRKDKLKKLPVTNNSNNNNNNNEEIVIDEPRLNQFDKNNNNISDQYTCSGLSHAKSMPVLNVIDWDDKTNEDDENQEKIVVLDQDDRNPDLITNNEYEKQLRKIFRDKSLSRSLRRAKSVYYRNRRSKSLEDLTIEEKINFLLSTNSSYLKINSLDMKKKSRRLSRNNSTLSIDSCSSATSNGLASDISSSYFHELSDWSPEFSSSESELSEDELFHNIDWDANFSNVALSGFNSTDESDETDDSDNEDNSNHNKLYKTSQTTRINDSIFNESNKKYELSLFPMNHEEECLKEMMMSQKFDNDAETVEKMLNEVMSRMLKIHPGLMNDSNALSNNPASNEYLNSLKSFQVTAQFLNDPNTEHKCFICMSIFDLDEDATNLNCDHTFHLNCIQVWLSKSSSCPTCRHNYQKRSNNFINDNRLMTKRETLL